MSQFTKYLPDDLIRIMDKFEKLVYHNNPT